MAHDLILLRHGRSEWNDKNLFTGWYDCPLNEAGRDEARRAASCWPPPACCLPRCIPP